MPSQHIKKDSLPCSSRSTKSTQLNPTNLTQSNSTQLNPTQPNHLLSRWRWFVCKRTCSRLSIPPRCQPVLRRPRKSCWFTRIGAHCWYVWKLCMHVCVFIYVHKHIHTHTHIHIHLHIHLHIHIHIHLQIYMYMWVCLVEESTENNTSLRLCKCYVCFVLSLWYEYFYQINYTPEN